MAAFRANQAYQSLCHNGNLVNARDNTQMWGEQYKRKAADLLAVQSEISGEIAEKLRLRLTPVEQQQLAKHETVNPQAFELSLKGRFYWRRAGAGSCCTTGPRRIPRRSSASSGFIRCATCEAIQGWTTPPARTR